MPKIKTTSKVPLRLTDKINPRGRDGRMGRALDPGHCPQDPQPPGKSYPTETINSPPWNMPKIETTSKVPLKLTSRINLGRRGRRVRQALDFGHSPHDPPQPGKGQ